MSTESADHGPTHDDCEQALEQLHLFLDHELASADADHIRDHLHLCEQCLDTYDMTQQVKDLVHKHCASAAPEDLRTKVLKSLHQA